MSTSARAMVAAKLAKLPQGARTDIAQISAMSQPDAARARDDLAGICEALGVEIVPTNVHRGAGQTAAGQTIARLLAEHGQDHTVMVLKTITETGNARALHAHVILGVSDVMLAWTDWVERGEEWFRAFDAINLGGIAYAAKLNRRAAPKRAAIAALLFERLWPIFGNPGPKQRRPLAETIALGKKLLEAKATLPRGHLKRYAFNELGLTEAQARRCMDVAKMSAPAQGVAHP